MAGSDPYRVTEEYSGDSIPADDFALVPVPERIGRYRIDRVLGRGGFGLVFLAHDEQLERAVAVKVPHLKRISDPGDVETYLNEARVVANLDHPHIIPVHDVGSTDEFPCYIVSKYIEGVDLATHLKQRQICSVEAAELAATVAEALHYAHKQGLVHRDIKPGNILIDKAGRPYVADFGLALREEQIGKGPQHAGTPAYMSPEQARGEGHRVDGRSDVFSLGVVLYEMLVGRLPFKGDTSAEIREQVVNYEPRPLRQYDDAIPKELDRICLKAIAKRARERYSTALDFAEDLRQFLNDYSMLSDRSVPHAGESTTRELTSTNAVSTSDGTAGDSATPGSSVFSDSRSIHIVPKGLRSFDAHDAEFFLHLLPGPRDRNGLPENIRFWKTRIEEVDPDDTFSIGLVYGPSGCGKSSLIKAGLLPRLSEDVTVAFVESTAEETESRLLKTLRKQCSALEESGNLVESIAALRRRHAESSGRKMLIVLDQFEQWLHVHKELAGADLVHALRQCDGGRVQCLIMVRDDFWLPVSRFMRELEVLLLEGDNISLVDLFDVDHARRVLTAFGQAYGRLPENRKDISPAQTEFLKLAAQGLTEESKVICVRLALFAEMMKNKPWTPSTLKSVGGTEGVGVTFLEETFSSSAASPDHRYHQKAARAILKALLPESGANLKGQMKPYEELLRASGYTRRPKDFDDLLRILDTELRLITPTDPEGALEEVVDGETRLTEEVTAHSDSHHPSPATHHASPSTGYYQLTHDYLVLPLRNWLHRKQKETRRGRSELRLAERSAAWNAKPERRQLPGLWEFLSIHLMTDRRQWSDTETKMMRHAGRTHGIRTAVVLGMAFLMIFVGLEVKSAVNEQQVRIRRENAEAQNETRAKGLVKSLSSAKIEQVPQIIKEIERHRPWADPLLETEYEAVPDGSPQKLNLALALLPIDDSKADYLGNQLPLLTRDQFAVVRDALYEHRSDVNETLWKISEDERQNPGHRFQAACTLASYDPTNSRWNDIARFVAEQLILAVPAQYFGRYLEDLAPAKEWLITPLRDVLEDRSDARAELRPKAAMALAAFLEDEAVVLTELILLADFHEEYSPILEKLAPHSDQIRGTLHAVIERPVPSDATAEERDAHWKTQALAAVTLFRLGDEERIWPLLVHRPDPSLRSMIVYYFGVLRADHSALARRLQFETDASVCRALILSLGGIKPELISSAERPRILAQLRRAYEEDSDPGVHSAAEWTLRQWNSPIERRPVHRLKSHDAIAKETGRQHWYVNQQRLTMVVIPSAAEFEMETIGHRFAIASKEVTVSEFRRFRSGHLIDRNVSPERDCPVNSVSWYEAASYCNWLSQQDGIPREEWCYVPVQADDGQTRLQLAPDGLERTGYRLPTLAEWDHACRAMTTSDYHFGQPIELLDNYAWYGVNSQSRAHSVGALRPNDFGLFDMHGNLWEWCQPVDEEDAASNGEQQQGQLCGGAFGAQARVLRSGLIHQIPSRRGTANIGFRPARTYR